MKRKVSLYESRHAGDHAVLVSKPDYDKLCSEGKFPQPHVEITSAVSEAKAYPRLWWYDESQNVQKKLACLEKPLMDTCLLSEGDVVEIRRLEPEKVQTATSVELEFLGDSHTKIQTQSDLQRVRTRILGGENILAEENRFVIPFKASGIVYRLLFRVLKTEPSDCPIRCDENTTVVFKGLSLKEEKESLKFSAIGGLKKQISWIQEMVQLPMEYPEVFLKWGITPPRGVLVYGPPGNGKTLLARTFAQQTKAHFYTINGPELISKFAGEGEQRLRAFFEKASTNAPSIIFIDEIDSFAGKRDSFASEFEVKMVAQLLALMDGLDDRGNVIVIAATNRQNALDPALRRPGRFDREIEIGLPSEEDRLEILNVHVRSMALATDVDLHSWAKKTSGYTGADLAGLAREAAICCFRRIFKLVDNRYIQTQDALVKDDDFSKAFQELQPTNLRELPLQGEPISWDKIIGLTEIKGELENLVQSTLTNLKQLKTVGLTAPSGILLVGPSNSGKKTLITSLAKKLGIQCLPVRSLDFVNHSPRQQGQTLAEIFRKARLASPSILLLEKLDSAFSTQLRYGSDSFLFLEDLVDEIRRNRLFDNVFVMGTARTIEDLPPVLLDSSVFGNVLRLPMLSVGDCEAIIHDKLGKYLDSRLDYQELAQLAAAENFDYGQVIHLCENCLRRFVVTETKAVSADLVADYFKQMSRLFSSSQRNAEFQAC
jgi:transitional endoplasmic reticulum ATPase